MSANNDQEIDAVIQAIKKYILQKKEEKHLQKFIFI